MSSEIQTSALKKKGLRPMGRSASRSPATIQTSALKKKGLRQLPAGVNACYAYSNVCPEEEGIKTRGPGEIGGECLIQTSALKKKGLRPRADRLVARRTLFKRLP